MRRARASDEGRRRRARAERPRPGAGSQPDDVAEGVTRRPARVGRWHRLPVPSQPRAGKHARIARRSPLGRNRQATDLCEHRADLRAAASRVHTDDGHLLVARTVHLGCARSDPILHRATLRWHAVDGRGCGRAKNLQGGCRQRDTERCPRRPEGWKHRNRSATCDQRLPRRASGPARPRLERRHGDKIGCPNERSGSTTTMSRAARRRYEPDCPPRSPPIDRARGTASRPARRPADGI